MGQYIVHGGKRLEGELQIGGCKNAVLPIIAATLLTEGKTILHNCPQISDVNIMIRILDALGCNSYWSNNILTIDTTSVTSYQVPEQLVREMRSSIICMGALLGKYHKAKVSFPGGCPLGARPIDFHLKALEQMGVNIVEEHGFIICDTPHLHGAKIQLDFPSVGATENIMLAAVLADGITIIKNAAKEPEIIDLQNYLLACGAKIKGAGTDRIIIEGVKKLQGAEYTVMPDRIIAGTYLVAGAITGGEIILKNVVPEHLDALTAKLEEIGCKIVENGSILYLKAPKEFQAANLLTQPYPGFPTDMQAQMMTLLTVANGTSVVEERVFEARYKHVSELQKMGANIRVYERMAVINGVRHLAGTEVYAEDLRGGAALVIAGLRAEGQTTVSNIKHVQRGYENLTYDLQQLGAKIEERE